MAQPTFEQIHEKYQADCKRIKALREAAEEAAAPILAEIAAIEKFQQNREAYLLEHGGVEAFGFFTGLYINGRDDKAATKKKEQNIAVDMKKIEAWLLKMLSKVGEGIRTEFGTVYKTRKESVNVADFEAYVKATIVAPLAEAVAAELVHNPDFTLTPESLGELMASHFALEAINKAANKTFVLEQMGEVAKDGSRPNQPPPGIDYKAFATVGVRAPGKD